MNILRVIQPYYARVLTKSCIDRLGRRACLYPVGVKSRQNESPIGQPRIRLVADRGNTRHRSKKYGFPHCYCSYDELWETTQLLHLQRGYFWLYFPLTKPMQNVFHWFMTKYTKKKKKMPQNIILLWWESVSYEGKCSNNGYSSDKSNVYKSNYVNNNCYINYKSR